MKVKTILVGLFCILAAQPLSAVAYAQLSSLTTQVPTSSKGVLVRMDSIDETMNIELNATRDTITVKEPGVYFILASGQVGAIDRAARGFVDMWMVKNGKPVPNSNMRMSIDSALETSPIYAQIVMKLQAGDTVATAFSASGPSLGFLLFQPDNEPAVPSFIISLFKIEGL